MAAPEMIYIKDLSLRLLAKIKRTLLNRDTLGRPYWDHFLDELDAVVREKWISPLRSDLQISEHPEEGLFGRWSMSNSYTIANLIKILNRLAIGPPLANECEQEVAEALKLRTPKPAVTEDYNRLKELKPTEVKRKIFVEHERKIREVELCCTSMEQLVADLADKLKINKEEFSIQYWNKVLKDWVEFENLNQLSPPTDTHKIKIVMEKYLKIVFGTVIGRGSFSTVYAGTWCGKTVAIKAFTNPQDSESYSRELNKYKGLSHPNVLQFFGIGLTSDKLNCIVTEITSGDLLTNLMKKEIKKDAFLEICIDVAAGMMYLGVCEIVHRDLAARNILLKQEGTKFTAKVADFGLSVGSQTLLEKKRLNVGTRWTAPEALQNDNWSEKSDVWSYGVLLFEIYSYGEQRPYLGLTDAEVQEKVINGKKGPGYPKESYNCPEGICKIMDSCWERNPEDRNDFNWIANELADIRSA